MPDTKTCGYVDGWRRVRTGGPRFTTSTYSRSHSLETRLQGISADIPRFILLILSPIFDFFFLILISYEPIRGLDLEQPIGRLDLKKPLGGLVSYEPIGGLVSHELIGGLNLKQQIGRLNLKQL